MADYSGFAGLFIFVVIFLFIWCILAILIPFFIVAMNNKIKRSNVLLERILAELTTKNRNEGFKPTQKVITCASCGAVLPSGEYTCTKCGQKHKELSAVSREL